MRVEGGSLCRAEQVSPSDIISETLVLRQVISVTWTSSLGKQLIVIHCKPQTRHT